MAIISFSPDTIIEYVPSYGGNRDSDNPCIIRMRFVPFSKVQHYYKLRIARTKDLSEPSKITEISQDIQKKQFVESVESISGYFVNGKEITTPEEFYETADSDLIIEIIRAMENAQKLNEGQKKI